LRQVASTDRPLVREYSVLTQKGERHFESRFVPELSANGTTRSVLVITRDITERRQAEEELRRSEAYLAEAQRLSHSGSWAFDVVRQKFVHWSPELSRLWGFDPDASDLPTVDAVTDRCHPSDRTEAVEAGHKAIVEKAGYDIEHRLLLPDGSIRYVQSTAQTVLSASGEVVEVLGTSIDVTERKRSERALRRARNHGLEMRYIAMMEERTRLAREIHDTLLQGFNGVVLLLMAATDRVVSPSEASTALHRVLDLAQATLGDARRSVWDLRTPSVNGELPAALRNAALDAVRETGLRLDYKVDGTPRALESAAESVVARVMMEAIANAVKHAHASVLRVRVSFRSSGLRLSVRDDGRGFQVDRDFQSYGGHWGLLGMRERARQVGATLAVRAKPGHGTQVVLHVAYAARCHSAIG
jgi:PAS domain S-box-containing protein